METGVKECYHLRALGNVRRDATGKRCSPPQYVDEETGLARLEGYLREHQAVVIFCACSYATYDSPTLRCHRFFVAEAMAERIPGLTIVHCEAQGDLAVPMAHSDP